MSIEGWRWRGTALKVLTERLDGISDLPAHRGKLFGRCVRIHAKAFSTRSAANSREVTIGVDIAFFDVPKALGERLLGTLSGDSEEG